MLVFINGRFASQELTGVQRSAVELLRALDQRLGDARAGAPLHLFRLLTPAGASRLPELHHIPVRRVGKHSGHLWEQLELPLYARGGLLLSLGNAGPLAKRKQIVTIHDASVFVVPETYSPAFRLWYQLLLPLLGRTVLRVVTVSQFSRSELARHAKIPVTKVAVIPNGAEHILNAAADVRILEKVGVIPGRFILAVGSQSPHKNFQLVGQGFERLARNDLHLVVAGGQNRRIFEPTSGAGLAGAKMVGYVTDGELRALYETAACFVFPSRYEGFGLPPLEAMACGCPVVVSRGGALEEVCGNAALYCDPDDPDTLVECIRRILDESGLSARLKSEGRARAAEFTWHRAATALLRLVDEAASR